MTRSLLSRAVSRAAQFAAAIPLTYAVLSAATLITFAVTRRYALYFFSTTHEGE